MNAPVATAIDTNEVGAHSQGERLAEYIAHVVDSAPTLSPAQRDRLALLLRGAGAVT